MVKPVRWGYTSCFVIFPFRFGFPEKTCFEGEPDRKWMGVCGAQWGTSGEVLGTLRVVGHRGKGITKES